MDRIEPSGDLSAEFAFLNGMLATSGGWTRSALAVAACDSPWFAAQVAALAPPPAPSPVMALAAGVVVALPLFGPLGAQAGEWGDTVVRQVLGHKTVDGDVFDFRDGEAVWTDSGKTVSRKQIKAMDHPTRREFYSSMGLAAPVSPDAGATTLAASPASPASERIHVSRDGREAPVLAAVRDRVAAVRTQRHSEYLALVGPAMVPQAGGLPDTGASADTPASPVTLFDHVWAQVALERQAAKADGKVPPQPLPALAHRPEQPASLYQQIWAEVQAERAAARGDGIVGTMAREAPDAARKPDLADTPATPDLADAPAIPDLADAPAMPDLAEAPASPDLAGDVSIADIADIPPDRDLIDASAAFTEPRG